MTRFKRFSVTARMAVTGAAALVAGGAFAQCCPSGGTVLPASKGLGESAPAAQNLYIDPAWSVYQFERDGITYLQINDVQGRVRAAVARAGDTAWVMPMGRDVDKVRISSSSLLGSVVYDSNDFVVRFVSGAKPSWIVVPLRKP
ncbi:hypothetical protein ABWU93_11605 [Xanthomonas translucens pv. translucens]|uniref:hypothetical protein n=1 Tax=Xanthomonas campestris pv. translucens TaxID=343 RepID=UPI003F7243A7